MDFSDTLTPGAGIEGVPQIDLPALVSWLESEVPGLEQRHVDRELLRAQIADRYRELGMEPVDPGTFDELTSDLVPEAWRRLALLSSAFELISLRHQAGRLLGGDPRAQLTRAFVELARTQDLLTMEVLRASASRIEELARRLIAALGATVAGETAGESRDRLQGLDYGRLLREVERAKENAKTPRTGRGTR